MHAVGRPQHCRRRTRHTAAAAPATQLPLALPRLAVPQVATAPEQVPGGKIKCQLTDGKENIGGVFTSQVHHFVCLCSCSDVQSPPAHP